MKNRAKELYKDYFLLATLLVWTLSLFPLFIKIFFTLLMWKCTFLAKSKMIWTLHRF